MPAPAITTGRIQPYRATVLPGRNTMPDRPHDAASLADCLAWAANCVWPDGPQAIPYTAGSDCGLWTYSVLADEWMHGFLPGVSRPLTAWPPFARHDEYAANVSIYILGRLAEASITVESSARFSEDLVVYAPFPIYAGGGYPVQLQSWERLLTLTEERDGFQPDTSDLWRWSAARKGDGPASAAVAERNLPGALATGQAMADALFATLNAAPAAPAPTPRRNSWR